MEEQFGRKWKSRTWLLTVWWMGVATGSLVVQLLLPHMELPIAVIFAGATAASAGYYAKRSVQESRNGKSRSVHTP